MGLLGSHRQKNLQKPAFFRDFAFTSPGPSRMIEIDCGAVFGNAQASTLFRMVMLQARPAIDSLKQ
jgi:hypothetical protein